MSCFDSSTAMRCRSNAFNPALETACLFAGSVLFLHGALAVPQEHLSQQNKLSSRHGQPRFFRPLFLLCFYTDNTIRGMNETDMINDKKE